jgi:CBS domain containing-hemolysin-like protein
LELALWGKLIGLVVFVLLAVLVTAAQASLFHVNRARLRVLSEQGVDRAQAILRVLERPGPSSSTVAALYTISLIAATGLAMLVGFDLAPNSGPSMAIVLLVVLAAALLLQLLARSVAIAKPEASALKLYQPLCVLAWLLAPLVIFLIWLERRLLALLGANHRPHDAHSAEEELRQMVESGEENGVLEEDEREMIHGIFELSEVTAREVMVPRIDVVSVPQDALVGQVLDVIVETGHSRLPMYEESIDNAIGLVYAKDVLKHLKSGKLSDPARPLARTAHFVPAAKKVDELLQELQQQRVHMAIVVDEYGGTAGIITIEDLLEEIVGEIRDEYDQAEESRVEQISDREAIFDARMSIREVNELLSLDLPDDEFDTLGGLVYDRLGKVPATNDEVTVDGCLIRVMTTEGRRIRKVRLVVER